MIKAPARNVSCGGFVVETDMRSISLFCQVRKGGIEKCQRNQKDRALIQAVLTFVMDDTVRSISRRSTATMRSTGVISPQRKDMEERGSASVISMFRNTLFVSYVLSVEFSWKPRKFTT